MCAKRRQNACHQRPGDIDRLVEMARNQRPPLKHGQRQDEHKPARTAQDKAGSGGKRQRFMSAGKGRPARPDLKMLAAFGKNDSNPDPQAGAQPELRCRAAFHSRQQRRGGD